MSHNPNCDGSHCWSEYGEVRLLPLPGHGNIILCRSCFEYEIGWRRDRNKALALESQYPMPEWTALHPYHTHN